MKRLLRLPLLLPFLTLVHPVSAIDVSTKLNFETKYVSYGSKFADDVWVPMLDVSQGDYYAGIWGYLPTQPKKSFEGEWDFFAGRTITMNKLVSFDVGATVYRYPRTDVDDTTLEGFFWVNLATPLSPKLKFYYDFTIENWIGEIMVSHAFVLNKTTSLAFSGHAGFRRPDYHDAWYYGTIKADLVFALDDKSSLAIGVRTTDNTDHAAVGHGVETWFGASFGRSW